MEKVNVKSEDLSSIMRSKKDIYAVLKYQRKNIIKIDIMQMNCLI